MISITSVRTILRAVLILICSGICALAGAAPPPIEAFARLPLMQMPRLAPDGVHLAAILNRGNETILVTRTIDSGKLTPVLKTDNTEFSLNWFHWVSNDRLVVSLRYPNSRRVGELKYVGTVETRLLSVRPDGSDLINVVSRTRNKRSLKNTVIQDRVIDWLPEDGKHILRQLPDDESSPDPSEQSSAPQPVLSGIGCFPGPTSFAATGVSGARPVYGHAIGRQRFRLGVAGFVTQ